MLSRLGTFFLFAALTLSAAAADPKPQYDGAAGLYSLERVTVVYPAGLPGRLTHNRLSAERRAAFLERVHDIAAAVAADDAVSEEQLRGHLLLLGWDNRLLGGESAPRPFAAHDDGRTFLSGIPVGRDEDLLFAHESPYAEERLIVFWSRIDLELDRLSVLPFVGSDWAVFRDYGVVNQGMFRSGRGWPPVRNDLAERGERPPLALVDSRSEHYTLKYEPGTLTEEQVAEILAAREAALAAAAERLGAPRDDYRVLLFVYPDRKRKDELCGVPDPIHSVPRRRELHMITRSALAPAPHAETHLLAHQRWGASFLTALFEGLAISVEQPAQNELPVYGALMLSRGELPEVRDLLDEEEHRALSARGIGFPASGLLVDWLLAETESSGFAELYNEPRITLEEIGRAIGASAAEVESRFRDHVEKRAATARDELTFRQASAEADRHRAAGDPQATIDALQRALEVRPKDARTVYKLALVQMRDGRLEASRRSLERLLELARADPESGFEILALYELGRIDDAQGRRESALERYRAVLALPDFTDTHRRARDAIATPVTADRLR